MIKQTCKCLVTLTLLASTFSAFAGGWGSLTRTPIINVSAPPDMQAGNTKSVAMPDMAAVESARKTAVSANPYSVSVEKAATLDGMKQFRIDDAKFTPAKIKMPEIKAPARAAELKGGYYISKDWLQNDNGDVLESQCLEMKISGGQYTINNIFGVKTDINLEVSGSVVNIPGQIIYKHASYGNIYICPVNMQNHTYDPTGKIAGSIDENGTVTFATWGLFVTEGNYKNVCFGIYTSSQWFRSNATVTTIDVAGERFEYPSLVEQIYENQINIYNFIGQGNYITAQLTPTKAVRITPQYLASNALLGPAYCYPADWNTNKVNTAGSIIGQGTDNKITLPNWSASFKFSPANSALKAKSTEINTTTKIRYPESLNISFEGAGTKDSPYLVKNFNDLRMMSQMVESGDDCSGKYFRLAADINLGGITSAFIPIGNADNAFNGTFIGDNKTISNLNARALGENYFALFGHLGTTGEITDLNVRNFTITGTGDNIAPIVAWNQGRIVRCHVCASTLTSQGNLTGGIAANTEGPIYACTFNGNITTQGNAGGIAGYSYNIIEQCSANGTIVANGYFSSMYHSLGGIVGSISKLANTTAIINECQFSGTLTDSYGLHNIGGLAGTAVLAEMKNSFNVGTISAKRAGENDNCTGGIVGLINESKIDNCFNAGTIMKSGTSEMAGGIIGYLSCSYLNSEIKGISEITNCYNSGIVSSTSIESHKGVFGSEFAFSGQFPSELMIKNCFFDSQISGLSNEKYGRSTSFFTASLPQGFNASVWSVEVNKYPVIKNLKDTEASKLAAAALLLSGNEDATKVKKTINLSADNGIIWQIYTGTSFVTETPAIKLSGNQISIKDRYANEIIVAGNQDGSMLKLYSVAIVPHLFDGEGTQASPYLVKDKSDFMILHNAVANFGQAHNNDYFRMTTDIDFNYATDFTGVGATTQHLFGGIFDGDGHHIKRLAIKSVAYDSSGKAIANGSYLYSGLFTGLNKTGTVKNLIIDSDCTFDFYAISGAVAGLCAGRIENCRNYADINGISERIGGITGNTATGSVVTGCYNAGKIKAGRETVGGIVGYGMGLVELCQNDGDTEAAFVNAAFTSSLFSCAGGIVGANFGNIDRCVNNANITASRHVGGIAGSNSRANNLGLISNSINNGLVHCTRDVDTRGAIVGYMISKTDFENNYYDGSINVYGAVNNRAQQGVSSLSTSSMIVDKPLSGLKAEDWDFKKGAYPVLAKFSGEEAATKLRSIFMNFADGEVRTNVVRTIDLSNPAGISWKLKKNENFKLDGLKLNVTIPTELIVAVDTLTATLGKYVKVFEVKAIPNVLEGRGTSSDPFRIETVEDLNKLANFVEVSKMDYNGFFFKLINNLDFSGKEFVPIALGNTRFQADFDGNGKTISNIAYENTHATNGRNIGMFGNIGEAGFIHNLTLAGTFTGYNTVGAFAGNLYGKISDCVNLVTVSTANQSYAAGFAGYAHEGSEIINCTNKGTVTTKTQYAAGFVARGENANITNCVNEGKITASTGFAGGIAASFSGKIVNCVNKGQISTVSGSSAYIGGLVSIGSKELTIADSHNEAEIKSPSGSYVAGVIAQAQDGNTTLISNCYNTGNITGNRNIGGLAGDLKASAVVENCYNTGNITGAGAFGGLIGTFTTSKDAPGSIRDSYNTGKVVCNGTGSYVGGFIGQASSETTTIEDCYNLGEVKPYSFGGGFAGSLSCTVNRCWNAGNVTGTGYGIGGFSGIGSGTVSNSYNLGNVSAEGQGKSNSRLANAGGLWGYGASKLTNCYNFGSITSSASVGGISGAMFDGAVIQNCYNAGKINAPKDAADVYQVTHPTMNGNETNTMVGTVAFDITVNPDLPQSKYGTGLTTREMASAPLGNGFIYKKGSYPIVDGIKLPNLMHFTAASFLGFEKDDDNEQNVNDNIYFGNHPTLDWTASDGLVLQDGTAYPGKLGDAWLQCALQGSDKVRKFNLNIKKVSGVEDIDLGREVTSRTFFDLSGRQIAGPQTGVPCIVSTTYSDGTTEIQKIITNK